MTLALQHRRSRPVPWKQRKTGWIGIDIGRAAIKLAQLTRVGGNYEIARSLLIRAPHGGVFDRQSLESGEVAQRIRDALAMHGGFVGSSAACVLSMSHCGLRTVIGRLDEAKGCEELIAEQLESSGSVDPGDEIAYWEGVSSQQGNRKGMTQVHVLSLSSGLAESVGTSLLDARLTCRVLDSLPFCAMRALQMHCTAADDRNTSGYSAVLDVGWSGVSLVVTHTGRPLYVRCLKDCGISELVRAVMDHLKLDRTQAFTLLVNCGLSSATGRAHPSDINRLLVDKCMPLIHLLQREMRATFDFVHAESAEFTDGPILLTGSGAVIPGLAEHIAKAIGQPTEGWQLNCRCDSTLPCSALFAHAASLSALAWEL